MKQRLDYSYKFIYAIEQKSQEDKKVETNEQQENS